MIDRLQTAALLIAGSLAFSAEATDTLPDGECWKASFTEQLSGPVREQTTSGGTYGYLNSYDGDFKWAGKPQSTAISSEYVFCFRARLDDGGVLVSNGKQIELDRLGSVKRPPIVHESPLSSYTSMRDVRDFPTLYGIFSSEGKPNTSMEIQLDRIRQTATVVIGSRDEERRRNVTYWKGTAVPLQP